MNSSRLSAFSARRFAAALRLTPACFAPGASGPLALTVVLTLVAGCPNGVGVPSATRREALLRVNDNLATIRQPLQYKALVSFKFRDNNGQVRSFLGHDATLIFQAPRSLRFDVRSLAGVVAQFGSNDKQYWVWIEPEVRKMWWGEWRRVGPATLRKLPVPPNELLDALMLRPLPESLDGGLLPILRREGEDQRLLFVRLGLDGQPVGLREIRLDPRPPYQPLEIVDRLPDGDIAMRATLENYQRAGADGPFTPRRYVVTWPVNAAEMRLDVLSAAFRTDVAPEIFELPAWQGDSEEIDARAPEPGRKTTEAPGRP